jgi:hypothetical protein
MTRKPSNFRQSDVSRAIKAANSVGLKIARFEIDLDTGKISLFIKGNEPEPKPANHVPREALARAKDYVFSEHYHLTIEYAELIATIEPLEALFQETPDADLGAFITCIRAAGQKPPAPPPPPPPPSP